MCSLRAFLIFILCCTPALALAETDIRLHGGISIGTGNLRIYITDRHHNYRSYSYRDRYQRSYKPRHHHSYRDSYRHSYKHRHSYKDGYYHPGRAKGHYRNKPHRQDQYYRHNGHLKRYPVYQRILIRDPAMHDYRRYRHQRSYQYR